MSFKYRFIVAAAVFAPVLAAAESGPMRSACMSDVKQFCGSIQPGGGHIRDCMKEHRAQLSTGCKVAIADRMLERQSQAGATPTTAPAPKTAQ